MNSGPRPVPPIRRIVALALMIVALLLLGGGAIRFVYQAY